MSKEVDIAIFDRMLDDPTFDPCVFTVEYTDKEIDGWRALWVLENQLYDDKVISYKPQVTKLIEKYNIKTTPEYLRQILNKELIVRCAPRSRGSLQKMLKLAQARENKNLKRFYAISKVDVNKEGVQAKKELNRLLKGCHDLGFKYRLNKSTDRTVQIALPVLESKHKAIRKRKEIQELIEFDTYADALKFMQGFVMGCMLGQFREVTRWENGIYYEMQRRKLNSTEGKV